MNKGKRLNTNIDYLRECFEADFEAGELYWRRRPSTHFAANGAAWNTRFAGKKAGRCRKDGYCEVVINGNLHLIHRVIWALFHDKWPDNVIDHIDRNPSNNCIDNLRDVSQSENLFNADLSAKNTTGCKGVFREKRCGHWTAWHRGYLGTYRTLFDAVCARKSAELQR